MKLLVHGYTHNVRSSRRLAEACKINIEVRLMLENTVKRLKEESFKDEAFRT